MGGRAGTSCPLLGQFLCTSIRLSPAVITRLTEACKAEQPAPHRGLTTAGVSQAVFAAGQCAGTGPVRAYELRHSAATGILHAGAR
jgi:hypothetical protein